MDPIKLLPFRGQVVELSFDDGARVRAHLLSVAPDAGDNHIIYEALTVISTGIQHDWTKAAGSAFACSAMEITGVVPTDGESYVRAPGSRLFEAP